MEPFYEMKNEIRDYAWGHCSHIPEFLGLKGVSGEPAAEMWMGAHPAAPSRIRDGAAGETGLDAWIDTHRDEALGPDAASEYGRLPFLFKLLAAGKSLSIQAHPDKAAAEEGFRREEALGIPRDAPERNYRDDNHKPEIIMAITPFTAMIGFRNPEAILADFHSLAEEGFPRAFIGYLEDASGASDPSAGLKGFLTTLLTLGSDEKRRLLKAAAKVSGDESCPWDALRREWVMRLERQFPGDIGILAPLFLNVVEIAPGEALYQPARVLHAYLDGFGLELMANSDNVLRGGLTEKNVDVDELASILDFRPFDPEVLLPPAAERGKLGYYQTPVQEFRLGVAGIGAGGADDPIVFEDGSGPAVVLVMDGSAVLEGRGRTLALQRGGCAFIPWHSGKVSAGGSGRIAVASVPGGGK